MAKELLYMDDIWIRYLTLPELSVEGFQANVTLVWVIAVVCRLVGCVGALRSLAARTGDGLRSNESMLSTTATCVVNFKMYRLFIFLLLIKKASQSDTIRL
jgi:hypothetical protein